MFTKPIFPEKKNFVSRVAKFGLESTKGVDETEGTISIGRKYSISWRSFQALRYSYTGFSSCEKENVQGKTKPIERQNCQYCCLWVSQNPSEIRSATISIGIAKGGSHFTEWKSAIIPGSLQPCCSPKKDFSSDGSDSAAFESRRKLFHQQFLNSEETRFVSKAVPEI